MPLNTSDYVWDYLIPEYNDRTKILLKFLQPYFKPNEKVLDINCGFSPLTSYLTTKLSNHVTGFDINPQAINYCQKKYPKKHAEFFIADDKSVKLDSSFNVLIHLGISPGQHPLESSSEVNTSLHLILEHQPRLVIIESSLNYSLGYRQLFDYLQSCTFYKKVLDENYTFNLKKKSKNKYAKTASERTLSVFVKTQNAFSLNKSTITNLLIDTVPAAQGQSLENFNLGFGFIYYSLIRTLRPTHVCAFGSLKGFAPISLALGLKDNHHGYLNFVDASYSDTIDGKNVASGGEGFWQKTKTVSNLFKKFGVGKIIRLHVTKTSDFLSFYHSHNLPSIDLLYIDANHTFDGFKYDFESFLPLLSENGTIVFHDALVEGENNGYSFGVKKYYEEVILPSCSFDSYRFPLWPGLVILQKSPIRLNQIKHLSDLLEEKNYQLQKIYTSKLWRLFSLYKNFQFKIANTFRKLKYLFSIKYTASLPKNEWQKYKELRLAALKDSPQAFASSYESELTLPDSEWQNRLTRFQDHKEWMVFAIHNKKLIGMLGAIQNEKDLATNSITACQFFVLPQYRGTGVSKNLIIFLEKQLKQSNYSGCNLFVAETQTNAVKSYLKHSFKIVKKESMLLGDGKIHSGFIMQKTF